ncbi:hypothetical protein BOTBODRAFT_409816 [Botryobasidium botryosum FD-172 SS1]|uniref:Uncharacterized protein n=1 Tax=Botryobasidium botryosum (strain FD-172 SS1) TaxID=930990 RepID=A0A067MDH6_BOTB1|nr:hypothetical protein BOTBODRAFT_409816 [Botryobasidium botryosum FD-172 SS1]
MRQTGDSHNASCEKIQIGEISRKKCSVGRHELWLTFREMQCSEHFGREVKLRAMAAFVLAYHTGVRSCSLCTPSAALRLFPVLGAICPSPTSNGCSSGFLATFAISAYPTCPALSWRTYGQSRGVHCSKIALQNQPCAPHYRLSSSYLCLHSGFILRP